MEEYKEKTEDGVHDICLQETIANNLDREQQLVFSSTSLASYLPTICKSNPVCPLKRPSHLIFNLPPLPIYTITDEGGARTQESLKCHDHRL